MNLYATLNEFKAQMAVASGDEATCLGILEAISRDIDVFCRRHFYCWEGTRFFDGGASIVWLRDDVLSVSSLQTDPNGDGSFINTFAAKDYLLYPLNTYPKTDLYLSNVSGFGDFCPGLLNAVKITGVFGKCCDDHSPTPYYLSGITVPASGMTNSQLTLTLGTGQGATFSAGMTIRIDNEQMYISAVAIDVLTLNRGDITSGINGTARAAHSVGANIYICQFHPMVRLAILIQSMRTWKRRESAFAATVGDMITSSITVYKGLDKDVIDMLDNPIMRRAT